MFAHGGFEHSTPNIPTDTILKIDTNLLFAKHKQLLQKNIEPAAVTAPTRAPNIRLASHALVSMGNGVDNYSDDFGELVRKVSIG